MTNYLRELSRIKPLEPDEEQHLIDIYLITKSKTAFDTIVRNNLWLVPQLIKRYSNQGVSDNELTSIGNEALIKAVKHYNCDEGILRHYAIVCINHAIEHELKRTHKIRDIEYTYCQSVPRGKHRDSAFLRDFNRF